MAFWHHVFRYTLGYIHVLYFSLSLPNDLKMYPLKINAAVKIMANIICLNGTCITKAITKEISAPAALKGIQIRIASRYLFLWFSLYMI
jgi:hypothetical protein